ncbi:MAG: hypothetical protein Q7T82_04350 [Armatimonadota bacterium]|nr:hypothetical protein [Armatimonadota bacterium]
MPGKKRGSRVLERFLRPTISDCLTIWLLGGLCFGIAMSSPLNDNDIWWQLIVGKIIVTTGHIPTTDLFSFTVSGKPWLAHEWMSEVVYWLTYSRFGPVGLSLLKSLLILATFTIIYITCRRRGQNSNAAVIATGVAALISMPFWSERPQLFGYLCLSMLVLLLQRFRSGGGLWAVVPLFAFWINVHASWPIGLFLLAVAGAEAAWDRSHDADASRFRHFLTVLPFAALALLITPRPFAHISYPFQYLGLTSATRHLSGWQQYVSEWQSPDFHYSIFAAFALTLVGLPVLLRWSKAGVRPIELAIVLILAAASLHSMRHMPLFAIVTAPFLAEIIAGVRSSAPAKSSNTADIPLLNWMILLLLPVVIFTRLPQGASKFEDLSKFPKRAFDYLQSEPMGEKLLSRYDWGGYAIFRLWPDYKVFIDGRADVYGGNYAKRVLILDHLKPGWRRELRNADPDVIVWPCDQPLTQALELTPEWRRVRLHPDDKVAAVFVPAGGTED